MKIILLRRLLSFTSIGFILSLMLGCTDTKASYIEALENKAYSVDIEGLMHAVSYGYYADAKMLLEVGVSPNSFSSKDGNHMPPLVKAAIVGDDRMITLLLKYKADINSASKEGLTPLLAAINANNLSSVKLLLNAKPDFSVIGPKHAYTALHTAARRGHASLVQRLVELGADVNKPNELYKRYTPLTTAIVYKHDDVALELIKHGANVAFL